jgi:hypothetical protein
MIFKNKKIYIIYYNKKSINNNIDIINIHVQYDTDIYSELSLKRSRTFSVSFFYNLYKCGHRIVLWCLCCYLLIFYCNKLYKSFCFWWWNRNENQKYNTDINICTNKSGPFIHETEHTRYMQHTCTIWYRHIFRTVTKTLSYLFRKFFL